MHAIPKKHKEFFIYINAANRKMYLYNSLDRIVYGLFDQECNRKEGYCGNGYDITYFCNTEDRMTLKGRIENYVFHQIEEATIKLTCGEYSGEAIELDNTILKHKKGKFKWANGDIYEGEFICDFITGKGTFFCKESNEKIETNLDDVGIEVTRNHFYDTLKLLNEEQS